MELGSDLRKRRPKTSRRSSGGARRSLEFSEKRTSPTSFYGASGRPINARDALRSILHSPTRSQTVEEGGGGNLMPQNINGSYWQPGQYLPTFTSRQTGGAGSIHVYNAPLDGTQQSPLTSLPNTTSLTDSIQSLQESVNRQFSNICSTLQTIGTRLSALEENHKSLEEEIRSTPKVTPPTTSSSKKRNRSTPTALQRKIRMVHNSFEEEQQFKTGEPVTSPHNTIVINAIVDGISTSAYSEDMIQRGCKIYKKTLSERHRHNLTPVKRSKLLRSRKQRAFERRAKFVKAGKEATKWKHLTPDMMSEEEKRGDAYIRHRPEYRSKKLNSFIDKLDERSERKATSHARFKRNIGTPLKLPIPKGLPSWMVDMPNTETNSVGQTCTQEDDTIESEQEELSGVSINSQDSSFSDNSETY